MIADKLLRPKSGQSRGERRGSCILWIFGAMLLAALFLRVESWMFPDQPKPLLEAADGLIQGPTIEAVEAEVGQEIPAPGDLLDSSVAVAGYYAQDAENIPAGSSVVVLARDGWRFVEILYRPGMSFDVVHATYSRRSEETVQIGTVTGAIINLAGLTTKCIEGIENVPGVCQLNRVLLFPFEDGVVTIASDGDHATDGELIALARSMIDVPEEAF